MDCLLSRPQMQLHEISNYIFNATGSSFGVENLCRAIEEVFAKVKHYLRQNDLVLQSVRDPSPLILDAFGQVTSMDCKQYMHHAGYI